MHIRLTKEIIKKKMSRAGSKTKLKGKAAAKDSPATDPEVSWVVFSHPISYRA